MKKIGDLFQKPIHRKIEEVIKVDQTDEAVVHDEITEYIATENIKQHFREVLKAYTEAPTEPTEGVGVWVSGFFGSGKSSFAKILGYIIENRSILEDEAVDVFCRQVPDERLAAFLDFVRKSIPTQAVIFDISTERGLRTASERVDAVMYKALLRQLDYCVDFDLAELEITLEGDGRLDQFVSTYDEIFAQQYGGDKGKWHFRRNLGAVVYNEASRVLHELDPQTYPEPDSWVKARQPFDLDANKLADRAFELMARRRPGKALLFVIDEVGQYVSRSVDKMLALQAVIQAFGVAGKNRVRARKAVAPAWVVVTSQEKLDEVVDALDSKKVELARLQDRFPVRIDLAPADIAEVAGRRILAKKPEAEKVLEKHYDENEGRINANCRLEGASYRSQVERDAFIRLYPYMPYQIDLCIDIMSGIRLQPGAQRHIGGSNRTIIKQAQQMLIRSDVALAERPVGDLVTLDMVYELVQGNLSNERRTDMASIANRFSDEPFVVKTAKAVCILEYSQKLPRTPANIAAVLWPRVDADSLLPQVQDALKKLEETQFVRLTEGGYKLQTAQEKDWDTKRRNLGPKQSQRNKIRRDIIEEIFSDPGLRTYRYRNLRTFKIAVNMDGVPIGGEGDITFSLVLAEDRDETGERVEECRRISREKDTPRWNEIFWVATLTEDVHQDVEELYRSQEMVSAHERLGAQGKLSGELSSCLNDEKRRRDNLNRQLRTKLLQLFQAGQFMFRGVQEEATSCGANATEIVRNVLNKHILDLFEKLELGARPVGAEDAEKILTVGNLGGLPPIFYDGEGGLGLVIKQGDKYVANASAQVAQEVLSYIKRMSEFGEKTTGKTLETYFRGFGYGWERDMLRLVLATLLRAGAIEVTYQGRRFRAHTDPMVRQPFSSNTAFRAAAFTPREALDLRMLTEAARNFEDITGEEVDIEESAIAGAFQKLARNDRERVLPLLAQVSALDLPGSPFLTEHQRTLEGIIESAPDDCVRILATEGKSFKEARERVVKIVAAMTEINLKTIHAARITVRQRLPVLVQRWSDDEPLHEVAKRLISNLEADSFHDRLPDIAQDNQKLMQIYNQLYNDTHQKRAEAIGAAINEAKGLPEWPTLTGELQQSILVPLTSRFCEEVALSESDSTMCMQCRAGVDQMESDIAAADALKREALKRVDEALIEPGERIERVRIADFLPNSISSPGELNEALEVLRERIGKLLAQGIRVFLD